MSGTAYSWRDSEVRSPAIRALNSVGARLERFGIEVPTLSSSSVMKAAVKATRSDDFGSASFREPLDVYLRACAEEAQLTTFGRLLISKMLVSALSNRIELQRWSLEHPGVLDERIESPWIIVGLPRTGTSLLSNLLGLDPLARPLLQWEAARPVPPASLERAAEDPRITRSAKDLEGLMKLNPPLRAMHPFGATLAEECVALFMYDVRSLALETQAHVPAYGRWLEQADLAPAYAQHRLALQTLQSRQPTQRWVLKTPHHLWQLEVMLDTYPDARVIWTHRDPGPVVTSLASLVNASQRILSSRRDPRPTAEEWKRKCSFALHAGMSFDEQAKDGWCQHLHYNSLIADPVETVRRLYRNHDEDLGELHVRRMRAFLAQRPRDAFGLHRYDPEDFGWTYAGLAAEFGAYAERYGIEAESADA
jgi:hypothetical protein